MEILWGYSYSGESRTIDIHIKTLRKKLEMQEDILKQFVALVIKSLKILKCKKKIFLIISSSLLGLALAVNILLILMTQSFFDQQVFLDSFLLYSRLVHCYTMQCFLARFVSQILLKPIQTINLENLENFPYPELKALIEKIKSQNKAVKTQFKHLKKKKQELQSLTQNMNDGLIFKSYRENFKLKYKC